MLPTLGEVLGLPAVRAGGPEVCAGDGQLERPVRWVHVSEVPWIAGLLEGGELILTTGIALPRAAGDLRRFVRELAAAGVCGVAVELGRRYRRLPAGLVDAAVECDLPLVALHRETRFVAVTQEVHTLILDERMRELLAADERQGHRALLTLLAVAPELPVDTAERAEALGVPVADRAVTALAVRCHGAADPGVLRDVASRAADALRATRVPALVGVLDDRHVVVLLSTPSGSGEARAAAAVRRVAAHLLGAGQGVGTGAGVGTGGGVHRRGAPLVIGTGGTGHGVDGARASVREAVRVADSAAVLPPHHGWFRSSDVRVHGLLRAVHESAGGAGLLGEFVDRELGPVLDDAPGLLEFLEVYCRVGGNRTAAAAQLFISRSALYDRIARAERVLGADLADPATVLSLHVALLARDALERPGVAVTAVDLAPGGTGPS